MERVSPPPRPFKDRRDAGRCVAARLASYAGTPDLLVLGLPRGGVVVAFEVAMALAAPLDVFLVRKIGFPGQPELAVGAIASGGVRVLNRSLMEQTGITPAELAPAIHEAMAELARRERRYRAGRGPLAVRGRTVILIDDGLATGSTMQAAIAALRQQAPRRLVVAVPIAPAETCEALAREVDEIVCAITPVPFTAVGAWYRDFSQTTDEEVVEWLRQAEARNAPP